MQLSPDGGNCERCHTFYKPVELILFDYNNNAALVCFACLKIVLDSLMRLPLDQRVERLQTYQQRWMECHLCGKRGVVLAYDVFSPETRMWFCAEHWPEYEAIYSVVEDRREKGGEA